MYIGIIPGPLNKNLKFFLIITVSIPNIVPNMPIPMIIIPMVVISMFSLTQKENNNLGNMHNKNI